jgi:putative transposase
VSGDIKPWMLIGKAVDGGIRYEGLILCIDNDKNAYWWIPIPASDKHGKRIKHHISAPRQDPMECLTQRIAANDVELRPFKPLGMTAQSAAAIEELAASGTNSRNLKASLARMREHWSWIEPYVKQAGAGMQTLLDVDAVAAYSRTASLKFRVKSQRIVRALRAYLLGGMRIEGLWPAWDRSGAPGKPRLPRCDKNGNCSRRPGRRNPAALSGMDEHLGIVTTEDVRVKLRLGYRQFKTSKKISIATAYSLTLGKFWAERVEIVDARRKITLLPVEKLPTLDQFRRHGPGPDPAMSARRINLGEHEWERDHRPLTGSEQHKLRAAGQCGTIDSTSDDQNLVLSVDRSVAMPTSWNTKVRDNYTGYIAGFYSGFEHPSTMTSLICIAMAADSKVAFCNRYGLKVSDDDWLALNFRRIRGDNGELKSESGISAMTSSEVSAEFVKAYAAERKGGLESSHFQLQIGATHQLPGSTQGKLRKRAESDPTKDACLTHSEYMYHAIKWILYYNNVQRVEHLLTLEMRRDKVEPTRAGILKWMMKNGYVVTDPPIQSAIRAACLPRVRGTVTRKGIRIFDPGTNDSRYIPGLLYNSSALQATGLTDRGNDFRQTVWVHLNPADISKVWLSYRGLVEVDLRTHDPELAALPLREWLQIAANDRLEAYLTKGHRLEILANDGTERFDSKSKAAQERNAQEGSGSANSTTRGRRVTKPEAAQIEAAEALRRDLDLDVASGGSTPHARRPDTEDVDEPDWVIQARAAAVQV